MVNKKSSSTGEFSHPFLGLLILGSGGFFLPVARSFVRLARLRRPKARAAKGRKKIFSRFLELTETGNRPWKVSDTQGMGLYNDWFSQDRMSSFSLGSNGYCTKEGNDFTE